MTFCEWLNLFWHKNACLRTKKNRPKEIKPDIPITDFAQDRFFSVANPKSPILTDPVVPVMKILSHLRSLCMMGGDLECRKARPFRICWHHLFRTLVFTLRKRLKYLKEKKKHVLAFRRTGAPHKPVAPGYDANGLYSLLIMRYQRFLRGTKRNTWSVTVKKK